MATETTRDTLERLGRMLQALPRAYIHFLECGETASESEQVAVHLV